LVDGNTYSEPQVNQIGIMETLLALLDRLLDAVLFFRRRRRDHFLAVTAPTFESLQKITEDFMEYVRRAEDAVKQGRDIELIPDLERRREKLLTERNKIRALVDQILRQTKGDPHKHAEVFRESGGDPKRDFAEAAFWLLHCDSKPVNMSPHHATVWLLARREWGVLSDQEFLHFIRECRERCQMYWSHVARAYSEIQAKSLP
jgi:hypothetical protein